MELVTEAEEIALTLPTGGIFSYDAAVACVVDHVGLPADIGHALFDEIAFQLYRLAKQEHERNAADRLASSSKLWGSW